MIKIQGQLGNTLLPTNQVSELFADEEGESNENLGLYEINL